MCIIVSKEKNKNIPSKNILKNCFNANSDGAGFMYVYNNRVIIEKGFFTFDEFYNRLMEVDKSLNLYKKSLVMHFRIGTSGGFSEGVCHPFPVSDNINDLQKTQVSCKLAMVHNGIISNFVYGKLSDTQNFVKDFVYPVYKINSNFLNNKSAIDLLYKQSGATKLCFLDKNDNITYVGEFITDQGIKYSNTTYKEIYIPKFTYKYHNYDYDNDYDYDYDYDYGYKYGESFDNYVEYKKNEKEEEYIYLAEDEVKELKKGMFYYNEDFSELTEIGTDGTYYIDEFYTLYELAQSYKGKKNKWLKLIPLEDNVYIYKSKNDFQELEFKKI